MLHHEVLVVLVVEYGDEYGEEDVQAFAETTKATNPVKDWVDLSFVGSQVQIHLIPQDKMNAVVPSVRSDGLKIDPECFTSLLEVISHVEERVVRNEITNADGKDSLLSNLWIEWVPVEVRFLN